MKGKLLNLTVDFDRRFVLIALISLMKFGGMISFDKKQPLFHLEREAELINAISVINQKNQ
ncbi:hypothetical protein SNE26_15905 [Mucilaginibacter sp. cycad4]|uniref:hypothetical protein n=1 Tax=Mucilaginibacter sp. cycad4 TaxID=3342096 RepID=UPI002AAC1E97|nr:hypothetical protein [Mucilaginibacter gossypii]WPU97511.1 hypothetical protein SNE26_15905 [Mucilaginibacter gossypii]